MKTILKSVLVLTLIFALLVNAFASTIGIQWDYLSRVRSELSINTLGIASASGTATLYNGDSVSVELNLQQLKSNGWTTIKTWNGSGTKSCTVSGSYAVYSGYDYRVETIAKVYDGNGNKVEESNVYSPIKNY
ncbi:hypothetical protein [Sedimentibacter sp.]|uniref:hypothetical protein n=1 Tax=Sedimentibacter sp. TaxID=1960295 RepID=UPI0028B04985|nr:hypothetical protein [Sedimentibacter sp.]